MRRAKKSYNRVLVIILVVLVIIALILLGWKIIKGNEKPENTIGQGNTTINAVTTPEDEMQTVEIKEVQIYKGTDRPIAVMIDNHDDARPQVGLNDAYIVYEIIVEGGYTRLMAVFKGADLDKIGPIRSARHYFLDYAMENDAIYVHYGSSPQALSDISKYNVNNINGISQSSSDFWRANGKYSPHDVLTTTEKILKIAEAKDYRTKSDEESILNYTADEVTLKDGITADEVYIPYSTSQNVSFTYDKDKKVYTKYANNKKQTDWVSKEPIQTKNIIITFAENSTLNDGSGKGRQTLYNTGNLDGYYITNGKAIKIKCEKDSRNSKTVYKDLEGNEIEVNDGNTFIQICPLNAKVKIEGEEAEEIGNTIQ